jgi:hypothetical protein
MENTPATGPARRHEPREMARGLMEALLIL